MAKLSFFQCLLIAACIVLFVNQVTWLQDQGLWSATATFSRSSSMNNVGAGDDLWFLTGGVTTKKNNHHDAAAQRNDNVVDDVINAHGGTVMDNHDNTMIVKQQGGRLWLGFANKGWNNQRQSLMAAVWMARALNRTLKLPTHFRSNKHTKDQVVSIASILDLNAMQALVHIELDDDNVVDYRNTLDVIQVNHHCIDPPASVQELRDAVADIPPHQDLAISLPYLWIDHSLAFGSESIGTTRDAFWQHFQFRNGIQACATGIVHQLMQECGAQNLHGVHLRVTDRQGFPVFDCTRGNQVFGRPLVAAKKIPFGFCKFKDPPKPLRTEDVLLYDTLSTTTTTTPAQSINNSSCIYLATDSLDGWATKRFIQSVQDKTGARIITYDDIDRSASTCQGISASILEQAIQARVPGRYVASWPSTWDDFVLVMRAQNGLPRAQEELALFRRMIHALLVSWKRPRKPFELLVKKTQ